MRFQAEAFNGRTAAIRDGFSTLMTRVGELTGDAQRMKSLATCSIDDGMRSARRAAMTARSNFTDARDDVSYRIKRQPFKSVGMAFAAGALIGVGGTAVAWASNRYRHSGE